MSVIPELRSDKKLFALHNRRNNFLEGTTNLILVFIKVRKIEVAVAISNSNLNLKNVDELLT